MDRTSVTQARLYGIQKDLGMNGSLWQTGISILSVPYMGMLTPLKRFPAVSLIVSKLVSQIPAALLIARTRPSILVVDIPSLTAAYQVSDGPLTHMYSLLQ